MFKSFRLSLIFLMTLPVLPIWGETELDLYDALLNHEAERVEFILREYPELLDKPSEQIYRQARGDYVYSSLNMTPLLFSIRYHLGGMVPLLLNLGADPDGENEEGLLPLHEAARQGDTASVRSLLDAGAVREAGGEDQHTALSRALEAGYFGTADFLVERGARLYGDSPVSDGLSRDIYNQKIALRDSLLLRDPGLPGYELLVAARDGDYYTMQLLLARGVDPDSRDSEGVTPLMMAAANGRLYEARLLLDSGADVNAATITGLRALAVAASKGDLEMLSLLKDSGGDLNRGETLDETALYYALVFREKASLEWLLQNGARVNRRDSGGRTATMIASWLGDRWSLEELLAHGAEPSIGDYDGNSAIFYAIKIYNRTSSMDYYRLIERLIDAGVNPRRYADMAQDPGLRELLQARWN